MPRHDVIRIQLLIAPKTVAQGTFSFLSRPPDATKHKKSANYYLYVPVLRRTRVSVLDLDDPELDSGQIFKKQNFFVILFLCARTESGSASVLAQRNN